MALTEDDAADAVRLCWWAIGQTGARRYLSEEEAADAVQDALTALLQQGVSRQPCALSTRVYRAVLNALDRERRRQKRNRRIIERYEHPYSQPSASVSMVEVQEVRDAAKLTPRQAEIAGLAKRGLTNLEIAAHLGVSRACVSQILKEGMRRVRARIM